MTANLFENAAEEPHAEPLVAGAVILRKFARCDETAILAAIRQVVAKAPFRQMITPGGYQMSVAMTNCGTLGWVTDRGGYRYDSNDPVSRLPWPAMPKRWNAVSAERRKLWLAGLTTNEHETLRH